MFALNVINLREFYHSAFGEEIRRLVAKSITHFWPAGAGDAMLAIGYATPFLEPYANTAAPLIVCMPAAQGAAYWPPDAANKTFLAHEAELPLAENSVNRVLLVHSLEASEQLSWMMQEIWRVLSPQGRLLVVTPNRLGLWARSPSSPFGHGRPFSMMQLRALLTEHHFTLTRSTSALFMPPLRMAACWHVAHALEIMGKLFCPLVGGVLLQEAEKQVYAAIRQPVAVRKFYPAIGNAQPALGKVDG